MSDDKPRPDDATAPEASPVATDPGPASAARPARRFDVRAPRTSRSTTESRHFSPGQERSGRPVRARVRDRDELSRGSAASEARPRERRPQGDAGRDEQPRREPKHEQRARRDPPRDDRPRDDRPSLADAPADRDERSQSKPIARAVSVSPRASSSPVVEAVAPPTSSLEEELRVLGARPVTAKPAPKDKPRTAKEALRARSRSAQELRASSPERSVDPTSPKPDGATASTEPSTPAAKSSASAAKSSAGRASGGRATSTEERVDVAHDDERASNTDEPPASAPKGFWSRIKALFGKG